MRGDIKSSFETIVRKIRGIGSNLVSARLGAADEGG